MKLSVLLRHCGACRVVLQEKLPSLYRRQNRYVTTVSRLTSAFNTKPSKNLIERLSEKNKGLFGIQELTDSAGFEVLQEKVCGDIKNLVAEACDPNRTRKMVEIFDELSDSICRVADMADFVRVAHPSPSWSAAAENVCATMGVLIEELNTNTDLYKALLNVVQTGDVRETTAVDQRVAELFLFDFEQSGIHLEESKRQQFVEINSRIAQISNVFMHNSKMPTPKEKLNIEKEVYEEFRTGAGYMLGKSLQPEHPNEKVREFAYKIFFYPNPTQLELLDYLLDGRRVLARLVGFQSYAHRALKGTLAESHENVMKFLWTVSENIKDGAGIDYKGMLRDKQKQRKENPLHVNNEGVMPWDPAFFTKSRKDQLYDAEELSDYLSLGACMDGLSGIFEKLFDITLETVKPKYGELWKYDVYKLAVVHKTEGVLGYIYCDFYEREGKSNQDCHFTIQGGRETAVGNYQLPIVVLHLNLPYPNFMTPALLSPSMMENLFHEFGHAMHSMLGRTQYQHVTGTRCPIDLAEVPSILMEYFASDSRVLKSFARHYETGKPIPNDLLNSYCKSKSVYVYADMQLQVMYAILDQLYHGEKPAGSDKNEISVMDILELAQNKHCGIPYVQNTACIVRFSHLVGYGGKYYSYLMSRAIAAKIWRDFFIEDPFNRENGEKYRRNLLAHGGEKYPKELLTDFFGEEQTVEMMVNSLMEDLEARANYKRGKLL